MMEPEDPMRLEVERIVSWVVIEVREDEVKLIEDSDRDIEDEVSEIEKPV